jgi:hypothetical protein
MNTTRKGKIARLPHHIREQLNARLEDNEPGPAILDWLNSLKQTHEIIKQWFNNRPITGQNLSDWRQGGYEDWRRSQQAQRIAETLSEEGRDVAGAAGDDRLSEHLSVILSVELAVRARERLDEAPDKDEKWKRLLEILRELDRLRRSDQRGLKMQIERQRSQLKFRVESETEERTQISREASHRMAFDLSMRDQTILADRLAAKFGPGRAVEEAAARQVENTWGFEYGDLQDIVELRLARLEKSKTQPPSPAATPGPSPAPSKPSGPENLKLNTENSPGIPSVPSSETPDPTKSCQIVPLNPNSPAEQGEPENSPAPATPGPSPATSKPSGPENLKPNTENSPGKSNSIAPLSNIVALPSVPSSETPDPAKSCQIVPLNPHSPDSPSPSVSSCEIPDSENSPSPKPVWENSWATAHCHQGAASDQEEAPPPGLTMADLQPQLTWNKRCLIFTERGLELGGKDFNAVLLHRRPITPEIVWWAIQDLRNGRIGV